MPVRQSSSGSLSADLLLTLERCGSVPGSMINEAEFGFRHIEPYLRSLPENADVLEVGSGCGILLSQISLLFPSLHVAGLEPIGPGFERFRQVQNLLLSEYGIRIENVGYERLGGSEKFDLIFLVNVFEHLDDWRHFLSFVKGRLKPSGKCVVLCPNYGFPYESHVSLPIIFSKRLTYALFKTKIESFERRRDAAGLWSSLNFVTFAQVSKEIRKKQMSCRFNEKMTRAMISRLQYDKQFRERQKKISIIANLVLRSGMMRIFELRMFHRFHPYMMLEITAGGR